MSGPLFAPPASDVVEPSLFVVQVADGLKYPPVATVRMDGELYLLDVTRLEAERALKHVRVHGRMPEEVSPDARRLLEEVPERAFLRLMRP